MNFSIEVQTFEPPTEREEEAEKKKKRRKEKSAITKTRYQLIANIKMMNLLRSKVMKVWEDHQAKVNHILEEKAEVEHLLEKTTIKVKGLQETIQAAKQTSAKMEVELALKIRKRREIEAKMVEERWTLEQISKARSR
ncbi:hypothetical protein COCNU_scaffold012609G000010 [Cocos nucifera]|nr:hypothetical protein [Cocos nucifera]